MPGRWVILAPVPVPGWVPGTAEGIPEISSYLLTFTDLDQGHGEAENNQLHLPPP